MNFNESVTKTNLARSFSAECQAGARYQFMSKLAIQEQQQFISDTMKSIAKNEMAHAKAFFDLIIAKSGGSVNNITIEAGYPFGESDLSVSLQKESEIEESEATTIYPSFARIARDEGFDDVAQTFEFVARVEETHHRMLERLAKLYKTKKMYRRETATDWKCSNCGHIETAKEAFKTCPLCNLPQGYVILQLTEE